MTNNTKKFVKTIPTQTLLNCVSEYTQYEISGILTDDSILRQQTEELMTIFCESTGFLLWVERLMFEIYRHFAEQFIGE